MGVTGCFSVEGLLARRIVLHGLRVGQPVDVVLEADTLRAIGFDVRCGDDRNRFLPLPAARIDGDEIEIRSALMLLDERDAGFYRRRTTSFRSLVGLEVRRLGRRVGDLADIELARDGTVEELIVDVDGSPARVRFEPSLTVGGSTAASRSA